MSAARKLGKRYFVANMRWPASPRIGTVNFNVVSYFKDRYGFVCIESAITV